jgi:hypothetical protein
MFQCHNRATYRIVITQRLIYVPFRPVISKRIQHTARKSQRPEADRETNSQASRSAGHFMLSPQPSPRSARGRNASMYVAVRTVHLTPGFTPRSAKQWPWLPHVGHIQRTFGYWVFRCLAITACIYIILFGVVTLGVYNKEGEEREAFAATKEAERRDRHAQE